MRKKIKNAYLKSEIIVNTGYSYQFVNDFEKLDYVEFYLPPNNTREYNEFDANNTMTRSELNDIIKWVEDEERPFTQGKICNDKMDCYSASELLLWEKIEAFKNKQMCRMADENKYIEKLTDKQKQLVNELIFELARANA